MIDTQFYMDELYALNQKIKWFINGSGIHCLPIKYLSVSPERLCELYNVEMDYFYPNKKSYEEKNSSMVEKTPNAEM